MSLTTGKVAEVLFDKTMESYEAQMQMLPLCLFQQPEAGAMQNAGNVIWRPVQQHAPILTGWDLSNQEQNIIEQTYPAILGTPKNDFVKLRADDMRDMRFWERRGEESGRQQATELNKSLAQAIATQGAIFYRSSADSGYDFIGEAQAIMNERQLKNTGRIFMLNDRDNLKFGSDLAGRQTLQGRPEQTWAKGQIGANVAEFDVYTGSFLPNLVGGATTGAVVDGDHTFAPEGGSVDTATGIVTNVDWRVATITIDDSTGLNVGDKIKFVNDPGVTDVPVNAVGLADKTDTGQPMTFTIVAVPDGTSITIYPKPIALNDTVNLDDTELAYANVDTQILDGAEVVRVNTDASAKTNIFWDKGAVEVLGGTIPAKLFSQYAGFKVVSSTMSDGQTLYMVYDGNIEDMSFRFRIFVWYGITVWNPSNCGVAVSYAA